MHRSRGFTMLEMMIVVAIAAVLAAIAMPSYNDYVRRGTLPEAFSALGDLRIRTEQFYQDNRTFVGACDGLTSPRSFTVTCALTATTATMTATGRSGTLVDGFVFTVDQAGNRTTAIASPAPTAWRTSSTQPCWLSKAGATC